jgi:hypothetical protein
MQLGRKVLLAGAGIGQRAVLRAEIQSSGCWDVIEADEVDSIAEIIRYHRPIAALIVTTTGMEARDTRSARTLAEAGVPALLIKDHQPENLRTLIEAVLRFGMLCAPAASA